MKHFEHELSALKQQLLDMGILAESMVAAASDALFKADRTRIAQVLASEPRLDRFQLEVDAAAVRLMAIYAPVARDLRFLLMIARINSELERIGDEAVNNCGYVELLEAGDPPLGDVATMSEIVLGMLHDALQAFQEEDTRKAEAVMRMDDRVDRLDAQVFRGLLGHAGADADGRARTTGLILVARSLERIADHATNICEEVFYLVEGADIRHQT